MYLADIFYFWRDISLFSGDKNAKCVDKVLPQEIMRAQRRYPVSIVDIYDRKEKFSSQCGYLELKVDISYLEEKVND
ncbi:hypothetical protein J6TS2_21910 [Heyndrickxia sporothermodurans]|nr:hypothetical protein J6TS2_21910 [Heyndrickxia sporothermodurans]